GGGGSPTEGGVPPSDGGVPPTNGETCNPDDAALPTHCEGKPSQCGYPDETNTGVPPGTTLTQVNGDIDVKVDGTVIDGQDIHGCVRVQAANVTIRNSKVSCPSFITIAGFSGENPG